MLAYKLICVWEEWFPARLICSIFGFIKKVQVEKEIAKPRYQGSLIQKQSQDSLLSRHRLSYSLFFFFFLETGFLHVAQAGLELRDPPASGSGIKGVLYGQLSSIC